MHGFVLAKAQQHTKALDVLYPLLGELRDSRHLFNSSGDQEGAPEEADAEAEVNPTVRTLKSVR